MENKERKKRECVTLFWGKVNGNCDCVLLEYDENLCKRTVVQPEKHLTEVTKDMFAACMTQLSLSSPSIIQTHFTATPSATPEPEFLTEVQTVLGGTKVHSTPSSVTQEKIRVSDVLVLPPTPCIP